MTYKKMYYYNDLYFCLKKIRSYPTFHLCNIHDYKFIIDI